MRNIKGTQISLQLSQKYLNFREMVPLARLERALLAELHFEWDETTVTI